MSQKKKMHDFFKNNKLNSGAKKRLSLSLKKCVTYSDINKSTEKMDEDLILIESPREILTLSSEDDEPTPSKRRVLELPNENKNILTVPNANNTEHQAKTPNKNHENLFQSPTQDPQTIDCSPNTSNSSATTVVYSLSSITTPRTPPKSKSPASKGSKYYSPNKKRIVSQRTPVKKSLIRKFNEFESEPKDDKTQNFISIIDKYINNEHLKHLLDDNSQKLLEKCMTILSYMKLMVRLYWRQHRWYQIEELGKIIDKDVVLSSQELNEMLTSLQTNGLITQAGSDGENQMEFDDFIKILKKSDIQEICKKFKLKTNSKKDSAEALKSFSLQKPITHFFKTNGTTPQISTNLKRVLDELKSRAGRCFKISDLARNTFYNLYVLMYLGIDYTLIRENRLELALLYDRIGKEPYPVDKDMILDDASVVFSSREEFYRYLQAHTMYEEFLETTDTSERCCLTIKANNLYMNEDQEHMLCYKSLPVWLRKFTPSNIYLKIMEDGVNDLKKMKTQDAYELSVKILDIMIGQIAFRQHKRANWYAEKALILLNYLGSAEEAAKVLLEGLKSDLSEEDKDAMRPRAIMIAKRQKIDLSESLREELLSATSCTILESEIPSEHVFMQPMDNDNQKGKLKFVVHTSEGRHTWSAEECCLHHYQKKGEFTHGEHWEGRIVSAIYSLLFWDIIYTKPRGVSGIFMSYYQKYPLDMFSKSFYLNRKTLIDERLMFIEESTEEMLDSMIQNQYEKRPQCEVSEVEGASWELVRGVTSCLGPRAVSAICRRLAHNYGYCRSGFPDLTLWNVNTKKIKFVEVKTDQDKPSIKQLQWLKYLNDNNIDAGFCYIGVNTTRSRARGTNDLQ